MAFGWQLVRDLPEVRAAFQKAFVNLDAEREPSRGHLHLARLVHEGRIRLVVSDNWDSCLERAHEQLYGTPLSEGVLYKPHGDVLAPSEPWTLPDEDGLVLARAGWLEENGVGITVNTVTPGFVATQMLENVPEKVLDRIKSTIPVGRLCHPEEIARVVHFLAADASAYITGQVRGVNGGLDM